MSVKRAPEIRFWRGSVVLLGGLVLLVWAFCTIDADWVRILVGLDPSQRMLSSEVGITSTVAGSGPVRE